MTLEDRIAKAFTYAAQVVKRKKGKDFAHDMGVTPQWISTLKKGRSKLGADKLWPLAEATGVRAEWIATGNGPMTGMEDEARYIPYYADTKNQSISEEHQLCPITKNLIRNIPEGSQLMAYHALDDSMNPTIVTGDLVLIDVMKNIPESGHIYAIAIPNGSLIIRRFLQNVSGGWILRSDNLDKLRYSDEKIDTLQYLKIYGRIIWRSGLM